MLLNRLLEIQKYLWILCYLSVQLRVELSEFVHVNLALQFFKRHGWCLYIF